jgi:hypothetical protein
MIYKTKISKYLFSLMISIVVFLGCIPAVREETGVSQSFNLKKGKMANYGATPWYTKEISVGSSQLRFALDSGGNFIWATSDLCTTKACNAHNKVNTSQRGFAWIDTTISKHSFGPWGSIFTKTGIVLTKRLHLDSINVPFFATVCYRGQKFQCLNWGGGIGFPSSSDAVEKGSGFYFDTLFKSGIIKEPEFSIVTYPDSKYGIFFLGKGDSTRYDKRTEIMLQPNRTGKLTCLWGTDLYFAQFGDSVLSPLTHSRFYLDTGSSVFKGDSAYLIPIMTFLYDIKDEKQNRIFEKIYNENRQWIGLVYANGGDPMKYAGILPDLSLIMGKNCGMETGKAAKISLNAKQYSYYVDEGDQQGRWVAAFTRLDGIGGLLVGSVFMDLLYTTFNYIVEKDGSLTQGNMYLYKKSTGEGPAALECVGTYYNKK